MNVPPTTIRERKPDGYSDNYRLQQEELHIQCTQTARVLDGAGITYDTYKVDEQPEKLEYIKSRYPNIMQAPIVTIRTEHPERYLSLPGVSQHESDENEICFSGFIPDVLKVAISESSEQ